MTKPKCRPHTFVLPPPNGYEALGICMHCGKKKMHYNSDLLKSGHWKKANDLLKATGHKIKAVQGMHYNSDLLESGR